MILQDEHSDSDKEDLTPEDREDEDEEDLLQQSEKSKRQM